jgi:hypothetical protein
MKKFLKRYSDQNPERFNSDFILSRNDEDIVDYIRDIFKALEILNEIEVLEVKLETDESDFGPIRNQHQYYKPIMPSRLNKIHYKVKITPSEVVANKPILVDENEDVEDYDHVTTTESNENSFIIEKDLFINKVVDNSFYINEGIRYFLIYQIVDNSTYGTESSLSLKSLLMPITVKKVKESISLVDFFEIKNIKEKALTDGKKGKDAWKEYLKETSFSKNIYENIPKYQILLFNKSISPFLYIMSKYAYNSLVKATIPENENKISFMEKYKDENIVKYLCDFFNVDMKFSDNPESLQEEGRLVFEIESNENKKGLFISVKKDDLVNRDQNLLSILGSMFDFETIKKKKLNYSYDDLITPWFWIDKLAVFFTKNSDSTKKFEKIKTMLISLDRLIDDATRKVLNLPEEDKRNTLNIIRYMLRNFETLSREDNQDLDNKRLRIYEYMLYPLRKFFSDHIYRVLNSPTRSANILQRIFSNLNPMYIIKQTVVNELLRYYNSTNEMNLYACLLKYTFRGPQSISKTVSVNQRDLHPSYTGRLSLVSSSASDPGISGTLVPFIEVHDYFFTKQKNIGEGE